MIEKAYEVYGIYRETQKENIAEQKPLFYLHIYKDSYELCEYDSSDSLKTAFCFPYFPGENMDCSYELLGLIRKTIDFAKKVLEERKSNDRK